MPDYVIVAKAASIERCVVRARAEFGASSDFNTDFTHQDAAILNILRGCEAAIDIATRIVRLRALTPPTSAQDAFDKLVAAAIVGAPLGEKLKHMVGFRSIAVHEYEDLNIAIVRAIIERNLDDLLEFSALALRLDFP